MKKVHFIGIGGIGISALAQYYLKDGYSVSGSDLVDSEITELLKKMGAKIFIGPHKSSNISQDLDLVIYSLAVQADNPELRKAKKLQATPKRLLSYPQALGELTKKYFTIAVSGSHGKSTTVALISKILIGAGFNPTVIIGTKLKEFKDTNFRMGGFVPKGAKINPVRGVTPNRARAHRTPNGVKRIVSGKDRVLIIEADEWRAAFLNYWPKILVLTNIEREHLDYYRNLPHILRTYRRYVSRLPEGGILVANQDDKNISKVISYLPASKNTNLKLQCDIKNFSIKQKEAKKLNKILKIPGKYNIYNALAALSVARVLKIPDRVSFKALSEYRGAWRRFEVIETNVRRHQGGLQKITVVSDYAHHPTEIKVTIEALRERFPKRKIWVVFQPHQYQRMFYLFDDFVKVLSHVAVDNLIITDIYDVAGRENKQIKAKVSSKKLSQAIAKPWVRYLPMPEIKSYLEKELQPMTVLAIIGAGDIYKLANLIMSLGASQCRRSS